jgi:hypothetical protein
MGIQSRICSDVIGGSPFGDADIPSTWEATCRRHHRGGYSIGTSVGGSAGPQGGGVPGDSVHRGQALAAKRGGSAVGPHQAARAARKYGQGRTVEGGGETSHALVHQWAPSLSWPRPFQASATEARRHNLEYRQPSGRRQPVHATVFIRMIARNHFRITPLISRMPGLMALVILSSWPC